MKVSQLDVQAADLARRTTVFVELVGMLQEYAHVANEYRSELRKLTSIQARGIEDPLKTGPVGPS